jgi:hypothetical protein
MPIQDIQSLQDVGCLPEATLRRHFSPGVLARWITAFFGFASLFAVGRAGVAGLPVACLHLEE